MYTTAFCFASELGTKPLANLLLKAKPELMASATGTEHHSLHGKPQLHTPLTPAQQITSASSIQLVSSVLL